MISVAGYVRYFELGMIWYDSVLYKEICKLYKITNNLQQVICCVAGFFINCNQGQMVENLVLY